MSPPQARMAAIPDLPTAFCARLDASLGGRFTTAEAVRAHHGKDAPSMPACPPQAVAYPLDSEEVRRIALLCAEHRVPIIPHGAGTSAEGHISVLHGGVCVGMSGMDRVLRMSPEDLDATVPSPSGVRRCGRSWGAPAPACG